MGESEPKKMQVFNRLKDFPLMAAVGTYAQTKYEEAKQSMFGEFINKAEKMLYETVQKLEPLTGKMERHLAAVDDLAIKGLNKMEEYFPITKKQPGEIKESLVAYAENIRESEYLIPTFKTLLFVTVESAKLFVEFIIRFMKGSRAMEVLVNVIDYLLPPLKDEETTEVPSSIEKFKVYYAKLSKRFNYHYRTSEDGFKLEDLLLSVPISLHTIVVLSYYEFWMIVMAVLSWLEN